MEQAKRKFDLFKALGSFNKKDINYYSKLSEEEAKELFPLVLMRWMTGTDDERQIMMLNEFANPYIFSLFRHKHLLTNLLIACSSGVTRRYSWIKGTSKKTANAPYTTGVVSEYFDYSRKHAQEAIVILTDAQIISFAEQLGRQPDEISKIKKELKVLRSRE